MIHITPADLDRIEAAAVAVYPDECCGLLIGHGIGEGGIEIVRVVESDNVEANDPRRRFEIDPRLLISLSRDLRGARHRIVGHYHSHPDHPARPSAHDAERAWQPEMVWLITSVIGGEAMETTAHVPEDGGGGFREIGLSVGDAAPGG
jgi:proteasome lid subunit RPN8/RPN11